MTPFGSAVLTVLLAGAGIGSAAAQGVVGDPAIISGCLCQQQGTALVKGQVDAAQQVFDQDRARIAALDQQIEQARARVNVASESEVDAVKALNLERSETYARTYDVEYPALRRAVESYDRIVSGYREHCTGRAFDANRLAQVQASLICPAPPAS